MRLGTIPLGFNPANQTSSKGKNPWDLNPTKFLRISYESKEALYYIK
jgi:hypothetical protein